MQRRLPSFPSLPHRKRGLFGATCSADAGDELKAKSNSDVLTTAACHTNNCYFQFISPTTVTLSYLKRLSMHNNVYSWTSFQFTWSSPDTLQGGNKRLLITLIWGPLAVGNSYRYVLKLSCSWTAVIITEDQPCFGNHFGYIIMWKFQKC